jgi:hypothetical protein
MNGNGGMLGSPRQWAVDLAVATGIGVFLGVIGPFGSFNGGPLEYRLFFWVVNLWIGLIILSLVMRVSLRAARRLDLPIWFALPACAALGALPLSLAVALFEARFWPGNHGRLGPWLQTYGQTLAITEPCAFGYYFLVRGRRPSPAQPLSAPAMVTLEAGGARFIDRLPSRLGRNLLCLQMEDHYVRAHTDLGSDLILTPLKAAVAELAEVEGLQVHRSWWVARRAVAAPVVDGRNYSLRLTNGLEVPVSRASVAKARALGWL